MAKDPYKYFRVEARELLEGLSQGIIDLEKRGVSKELVNRLLRLAHTLKGAARVVRQGEVSELAHGIEELLEPFRDATGLVPRDRISRLLELVDTCGERLKPVFSPPEQERAAVPAPPQEPEGAITNVRVEIAEMDTLLYDLADATAHIGAVYQETAALDAVVETANALVTELASVPGPSDSGARARAEELRTALKRSSRSLRAGLDRAQRDLGAIRDRASDLRLLPARAIFAPMERAARDAADALKKRVVFEAAGGEHRLDAHVLLALRDALAHVVRNAVAHGIEPEPARAAAGKAPEGRVRLRVQKRGNRVHFVVDDDGAGVNLTAIQDSLIAKRLIPTSEARALQLPEATRLLLQGGVSTAPEVSEVMGRGIGLDVVRATVGRLKGEVELRSEPGRGTALELMVPVSLESMDVLSVSAGESSVLIPFDAIRQTMRLANKDLARSASGAALVLDGHTIPFVPLAEVLSKKRLPGSWPQTWTVVVLRARGAQGAIGVNRLNGVRNVVLRPLPALSGSSPLVAGATLDGEGNPELVLDPPALITAVRSVTGPATEPVVAPPASVLVVDDSLTSRMLEQSILETAGYRVDLAVSGEDALEKAKQKPYALFVVDVEMPGMNGFELLERFRADPVLQKTPAVLVTSRASGDDRRRGEQVGARAHIAKGDFEEAHLLRTIRRLIEGEST
ncbi:signal transduction histidine kinase : CheA signal transduction histidine kinase OS=Anaeromyxobacter sp. (strain Fw109-5) GN=Anae109_2367 PE=4 SV=1: Hpt: HATPase_c: CheW: Response_reg [Gemmata massiliana]|uniref:histidine kinase n=1 Tax=Gemmata massiliana TaxID=1210884 RepID=A0A6P2CUA0_9BACT|nr:response regulator [Gemmata massiliana]VTR92561.1 signal transduction histidine kinase : CheA signal transduction histidine kinase OS=Anaeromyxobacter sp. (strain Fw109-5) GN=Anae109_2367 PE=4 SV=1: Hpt: HATPase_c: CheW: Response_reg [Gemmata massiliana]